MVDQLNLMKGGSMRLSKEQINQISVSITSSAVKAFISSNESEYKKFLVKFKKEQEKKIK